jgi:hypothetical protein
MDIQKNREDPTLTVDGSQFLAKKMKENKNKKMILFEKTKAVKLEPTKVKLIEQTDFGIVNCRVLPYTLHLIILFNFTLDILVEV